jgi:hypothetical protein
VKKGVDAELDALMQEYQVANELFNGIHRFLNMVLRASLNLPDDSDYVKINTTEKMGSSLQITKTRAKVLKQLLDKAEYGGMPCFRGILTKVKTGTIMFHNNLIEFGDLKFKPATTAAEEIVFDQLTKLTTKIFKLEHAIEHKTSLLYAEFVEKILENECYEHIDKMVESYPAGRTAPRVTWRLQKQIIEIDGSVNPSDISMFVDTLPIMDSKFIRNFMRDNEPSLDLTRTAIAPSGELVSFEIAFGVEFFRPFF